MVAKPQIRCSKDSYGGWIAVEGLPPHLWTNNWFQKIGATCGGLVEVDGRCTKFEYLLEARLKIQPNATGFIPKFINVGDVNTTFS